jgi:putative spermidine/putrescine transport system substrate-binding protein
MNAMIDPKKQAALAGCIGYGPTNSKAFDGMDPALAAQLPSSPQNKPLQAIQDLASWSQMAQAITERYNAWKLG